MIIALIVILVNYSNIPSMFVLIFQDAFNFRPIVGAIAGSCIVFGIKRGLFSNEAGVGSAPNASASASVSHPTKQGLVQTLSVYIDTMLLCTATALMCLSTGVARDASVAGAPCAKCNSVSVWNYRACVHNCCNGTFRIYNFNRKPLLCGHCTNLFK